MSILDRVLSLGKETASSLKKDLGMLDKVQSGLGKAAMSYVLSGSDETVLATLGTKAPIHQLSLVRSYGGIENVDARHRLLAQKTPEIPVLVRYTRVLAAAAGPLKDDVVGSKSVPAPLRVLFHEVFDGLRGMSSTWPPTPLDPAKIMFTPAVAEEVTTALGGSRADLVDLLFEDTGTWASLSGSQYRETFDCRALIAEDPAAAIEAGTRMSAPGRAALLTTLGASGLLTVPAFRDFALDLAGNGAKSVREAAVLALKSLDAKDIEQAAIARLTKGNANTRGGMVEVLALLGTETALAALRAHRTDEKTARIAAKIDTVLSAEALAVDGTPVTDDATGYTAVDGSRVDIPPMRPLDRTGWVSFGEPERRAVDEIVTATNAAIDKENDAHEHDERSYRQQRLRPDMPARSVALFANPEKTEHDQIATFFLAYGAGRAWARSTLAQMPEAQALPVILRAVGSTSCFAEGVEENAFGATLLAWVNGASGDLRHLDDRDVALGKAFHYGGWGKRKQRPWQPGDLLRHCLSEAWHMPDFETVPVETIWPYLATHLSVLDEALGLGTDTGMDLNRPNAVKALAFLPKPPLRHFAVLLEMATGANKNGRAEARVMLAGAPTVDERLINLLDDSRQAVRAGAAEWLADRRPPQLEALLKKRLRKENSDLVRAAILTGLANIGSDLSDYLGPKALLAEAEKGLTKAKFEKLAWLGLATMPTARFRDGAKVPTKVLRWWLFSACKLKQPGGNGLLDIYLDQLLPADAERFSTWVLDGWVAYDSAKMPDAEVNAEADRAAKANLQFYKRYYGEEAYSIAFANARAELASRYLNSGAETKGILGLAKRSPPALAADRVRHFLRNHGKRTSQASALLEMLARMGDPVSLQVVIMAATRLRQKGVQDFAGKLVDQAAEDRGWTMDELADRTIPIAGLEDDGTLPLRCGEAGAVYTARLGDDLKLKLANPDGKPVKALPSTQDDATKAAKKQLTASKKELTQVVAMQTARLYEALCAERSWAQEDWQRDFGEHPIMRRLTERAVWLALDAEGTVLTAFRPTAEGDYTDAEDNPVDPANAAEIRLAHGALVEDGAAWVAHLADYEVPSLFQQFGRPLLTATDDLAEATVIEDRKGWVTDTFTIRGVATKLGYERGDTLDGGYFKEYVKSFRSAGLQAAVEFSGNTLPEENNSAAVVSLSFFKLNGGKRMRTPVALGTVMPVLLSECWNDYHSMAAKAAFDPEWRDKMPWM
ncbi:MAG: DUF4132 domain-containing protein [Pseudomonadota bacterium]